MASLIWLGNLFGSQECVKVHSTIWNLDEDIRKNCLGAFIAKGNIIEGIEAKT